MSKPAFGVEIIGQKEVQEALRAFQENMRTSIADAVQATAIECLQDVKKSMRNTPKTGNRYRRQKKSKRGPAGNFHIASSAGNPPAVDFGTLWNSAYYMRVDEYTAAIGSRLKYAEHLEFGTLRMAARPAWIPAAERIAPRLQKRLLRIIQEAAARAQKGTA